MPLCVFVKAQIAWASFDPERWISVTSTQGISGQRVYRHVFRSGHASDGTGSAKRRSAPRPSGNRPSALPCPVSRFASDGRTWRARQAAARNLTLWARTAMAELSQSICRDLTEKKVFAWLTR